MITLTKSDLADLDRYPASLQQAALALWGRDVAGRVQIKRQPAAAHPAFDHKKF
jgi:hypothetical protein